MAHGGITSGRQAGWRLVVMTLGMLLILSAGISMVFINAWVFHVMMPIICIWPTMRAKVVIVEERIATSDGF